MDFMRTLLFKWFYFYRSVAKELLCIISILSQFINYVDFIRKLPKYGNELFDFYIKLITYATFTLPNCRRGS